MYNALQLALRRLLEHPGHYASMQMLMEVSGLDAGTLQAELQRLANKEPKIEGSEDRGYRYVPGPWLFCPEIFSAALGTQWWGQRIHYRDQLNSTMDTLRELIENGWPAGSLAVTDHQSAGRGRQGNQWHAPCGKDILCSFFMSARNIAPITAAAISVVTGLAITEFLCERFDLPAKLVWPNDVYVSGHKIAGVLVEGPLQEGWIIGFGLNVNSNAEDWLNSGGGSANQERPRTSLIQETGRQQDRTLLLAELGKRMESCLDRLTASGLASLRSSWNQHSALLGQSVSLKVDGIERTGMIKGMDEEARLILETEGGEETLDLERAAGLHVLEGQSNHSRNGISEE